MTNFNLIKLTVHDAVALQVISKQTFLETFAELNSEADMNAYLEEALSVEKLTAELSNSNSAFYFAMLENSVVGYLKLNFGNAQTELQQESCIEIERIYVLKEFLGKKLGQFLFEKALSIAKEKQVDFIWLGVWENNYRAINFYKKLGFVEFDKHIFRLGTDEQIDLMMKLELNI